MQLETIAERLEQVNARIAAACRRSGRSPEEVTLIGVTKGVPRDAIREAVRAGIGNLGENRLQEAQAKRDALADLPKGVVWHMIGHLQSNKAKTATDLFAIIHSVDSLHLAEVISRRASKPLSIFLEVNVSGESSKNGLKLDDVSPTYDRISSLPNLAVIGLMTVAPQVSDVEDVRPVFRTLRESGAKLGLNGLSMGMSDDFEIAIQEGATHLRIGRAIFGEQS